MKTTKEIKEQEDRSFEEDDSPDIPPPDIVAYNESRSCADLYRMYTQGLLEIQPEFQREIVWKGPAQTRFVDSLIKAIIYLTNPTRHRQHRVDPNRRPRHFQETLVSVATLQDPP